MPALIWKNNKTAFLTALVAATSLGALAAEFTWFAAINVYAEFFAHPLNQSVLKENGYLTLQLQSLGWSILFWTPIWLLGYYLIHETIRFALPWFLLFGITVFFILYCLVYHPRYIAVLIELGVSLPTFLKTLQAAGLFSLAGGVIAAIIFLFWKLFRLR